MNKMFIDIGSTYFKISANNEIDHYFRDFNKEIFDDLNSKCSKQLKKYKKEDIYICSSANGGLRTLIIGLSESFSIKFARNIAFNSGINIIKSLLYRDIQIQSIPSGIIDVVIIVGGIDGVSCEYDDRLLEYLSKVRYSNVVYAGSHTQRKFLSSNIDGLEILDNVITKKLQINEEQLKSYLTNLYNRDIMGKNEIKQLYTLTSNQIYSTPYIVNKSLPFISTKLEVVDPFILVDIGGATTDIHYSKDLVDDNIITQSGYDRLVFKKLGVYKSRDSLIFSAKNNEFVYELLAYLNTTEDMLDNVGEASVKLLMRLAVFLVLYKVSHQHKAYLNIHLNSLNSIVLTGGITKVLEYNEICDIVSFFYKKILNYDKAPLVVIDTKYAIWTLGMDQNKDESK